MAKRFKYRLETVLKLRKRDEDACKRVVADRLRRIQAVQFEIAGLQGQIRSEIVAFRQKHAVGTLDMGRVQQHRHWLIHLNHGVWRGQAHLAELEKQLSDDRKALAEARKRARIMEKLKERQLERHKRELDRAEAIENDEIGGVLYLRQMALATE